MQTSPRLPATREHKLIVVALVALALAPVAQGCVAGPLLGSALAIDPARGLWVGGGRGSAVWLALGATGCVMTGVALIAALGVAMRQPWGRVLGLLVSVLSLATGCFPVGAIVAWWLWTHPPEA